MLLCTNERYPVTFDHWLTSSYHEELSCPRQVHTGTFKNKFRNIHTRYIQVRNSCTRTYQVHNISMFPYCYLPVYTMYWYEHFRRVSSRVSGFQMQARARRRLASLRVRSIISQITMISKVLIAMSLAVHTSHDTCAEFVGAKSDSESEHVTTRLFCILQKWFTIFQCIS